MLLIFFKFPSLSLFEQRLHIEGSYIVLCETIYVGSNS